MGYFEHLYETGSARVKNKSIVIFGMVRDCGDAVRHNIYTIEEIGAYFADYRVIVFENNSKDNTKDVLQKWQQDNIKVTAVLNDFDEGKYSSIPYDCEYYPYFQLKRLQKYFDYRNMAMEILDSSDFYSDYSMLVDLDVPKINVKGVITSFGSDIDWDAVTANGFSYSPKLKRRYHDTFALCESGLDGQRQTIRMIRDYQEIFSFLHKGMPFIRVFSAYGGIAIFRSEAIRGMRYVPILNNYGQVQVRCEHFSLFKTMTEHGYDKVYINPNMEVLYQKITPALIWKKIMDTFHLNKW